MNRPGEASTAFPIPPDASGRALQIQDALQPATLLPLLHRALRNPYFAASERNIAAPRVIAAAWALIADAEHARLKQDKHENWQKYPAEAPKYGAPIFADAAANPGAAGSSGSVAVSLRQIGNNAANIAGIDAHTGLPSDLAKARANRPPAKSGAADGLGAFHPADDAPNAAANSGAITGVVSGKITRANTSATKEITATPSPLSTINASPAAGTLLVLDISEFLPDTLSTAFSRSRLSNGPLSASITATAISGGLTPYDATANWVPKIRPNAVFPTDFQPAAKPGAAQQTMPVTSPPSRAPPIADDRSPSAAPAAMPEASFPEATTPAAAQPSSPAGAKSAAAPTPAPNQTPDQTPDQISNQNPANNNQNLAPRAAKAAADITDALSRDSDTAHRGNDSHGPADSERSVDDESSADSGTTTTGARAAGQPAAPSNSDIHGDKPDGANTPGDPERAADPPAGLGTSGPAAKEPATDEDDGNIPAPAPQASSGTETQAPVAEDMFAELDPDLAPASGNWQWGETLAQDPLNGWEDLDMSDLRPTETIGLLGVTENPETQEIFEPVH